MRTPKPVLWRRIWSMLGGPKYPAKSYSDIFPCVKPAPKPPSTYGSNKPFKVEGLNSGVSERNSQRLDEAKQRLFSAQRQYRMNREYIEYRERTDALGNYIHTIVPREFCPKCEQAAVPGEICPECYELNAHKHVPATVELVGDAKIVTRRL